MIKDVMPEGVETMEHNCPVCKSPLFAAPDPLTGMRVGGWTVWCGQNLQVCSAQDVSGHGKNAKEAYAVVKDKFLERKDR